jgi:hypothetical protein
MSELRDVERSIDWVARELETIGEKTMTIRDQFAMAAMAGYVALGIGGPPEHVAREAYALANAMMIARDKPW